MTIYCEGQFFSFIIFFENVFGYGGEFKIMTL